MDVEQLKQECSQPIVEQCEGCARIGQDGKCTTYLFPAVKWSHGKKCPMATHLKPKEAKKKKFINPLKKSKRRAKGKEV